VKIYILNYIEKYENCQEKKVVGDKFEKIKIFWGNRFANIF